MCASCTRCAFCACVYVCGVFLCAVQCVFVMCTFVKFHRISIQGSKLQFKHFRGTIRN